MNAEGALPLRRRFDRWTVGLFLALIAAPAVDSVLRPEGAESARVELRRPAPLPGAPASLAEALSWPERFTSFHGDAFGLRDMLLGLRARLLLMGLGLTPTPMLEVGPQGWLFLTDGGTLAAGRGTWPLSESELVGWRRALESRREFCERRGVRFLAVFAPEKGSIYPEQLPEVWRPLGKSRLDQLLEHLRLNSAVDLLDLRAALLEERRRDTGADLSYYPLGSHWTDRGAFAASAAIVERLRAGIPALEPADRTRLAFAEDGQPGDNWSRRLHLRDALQQANFAVVPLAPQRWVPIAVPAQQYDPLITRREEPQLPRVLVVHDSFGGPLRRFLAEHFGHGIFLWQLDFPVQRIEDLRPDAVVWVYAERVLCGPQQLRVTEERALEQEFAAAKQVLWRTGFAPRPENLMTEADLELADAADGLRLSSASGTGRLVLPGAAFDPGAGALLRIEMSSQEAGRLDLFYRTLGQSGWSRRNTLRLGFAPGRQVLFVELAQEHLAPGLALRLTEPGARIVMHSLEVRRAP